MSQDQTNWKKLEEMLSNQSKMIIDNLNKQPKKEVSSGNPHKTHTLAEMIDCPECGKGAKEALMKLMSMKECKSCGHVDHTKEEYCEDCGEEY